MEMHNIYDIDAVKKPVNLSANTDLIQKAKKLGINLSNAFERAVAAEVRIALETQWREESKAGIEAYNRRVERQGVFGSEHRRY